MKIDIGNLFEAELVDPTPDRRTSAIRASSTRAQRMLEFQIGDRVAFRPEGLWEVIGILSRYTKKTVTIITDAWKC